MKNPWNQFKESFLSALPTISLALFLLFSIKAMGVSDHIILAIIMPFYFRSAKSRKINIRSFCNDAVVYTLLSLLSHLATVNSITMMLLNLLVPFGIVFFLCNERSLSKYTLYGLVFIYFQRYSLPAGRLPVRVFAFAYAFAITFVWLCICLKRDHRVDGIFDNTTPNAKARSFHLESPHTRFALRLSITMLLSSILTAMLKTHIQKADWLHLNAYLMMLPLYEDTITRLELRIKGTILGAAVVAAIVGILGLELSSVLICTVTLTGMFMAKQYDRRTIVTTSLALLLTVSPGEGYWLILLRVASVVTAAALVYMGNRLILPSYKSTTRLTA